MIKDLSKYKRLFTFGCSFTNYRWPTWAHVLASEIENVEFYNFGKTGSGNLSIALRITEANKRYHFNENDLVAVMYTSFTREDRWVNGSWIGQGNIYNQKLYTEDWVKEFADPDFYLIRDFALIELTNTYLKSLPCTSLLMSGWPLDLLENNKFVNGFSNDILETCSNLYQETTQTIKLDLRSFEEIRYQFNKEKPNFSMYGHTYTIGDGSVFQDGHPNPNVYREYLEYIGIPLTDKSKIFSEKMTTLLKSCKTDLELQKVFKGYYELSTGLF